jgi:hypothetical protein
MGACCSGVVEDRATLSAGADQESANTAGYTMHFGNNATLCALCQSRFARYRGSLVGVSPQLATKTAVRHLGQPIRKCSARSEGFSARGCDQQVMSECSYMLAPFLESIGASSAAGDHDELRILNFAACDVCADHDTRALLTHHPQPWARCRMAAYPAIKWRTLRQGVPQSLHSTFCRKCVGVP